MPAITITVHVANESKTNLVTLTPREVTEYKSSLTVIAST